MPIPVTIGVTGYRDLREQDIPLLREIVHRELKNLKDKYLHTSFVMVCSLAEGADQLCAEIAIKLGFSLIVPLPLTLDEYRKDFKGFALDNFEHLLASADDVFTVPDTEKRAEDTRDYGYRQAGIYVASHSHILLALWNGYSGKPNGCGTAETVAFALDHNYAEPNGIFSKASGDGIVIQVVTPREKGGTLPNAFYTHLIENEPGSFNNILKITDAFNADCVKPVDTENHDLTDTNTLQTCNNILRRIHETYIEATALSVKYQKKYLRCIKWLAILGMGLVLSFLIYDILESDIFLPVYGLMLVISAFILYSSKKSIHHTKYIEYRVLAETLRVQFYLTLSGVSGCVCDRYTWSQKCEVIWVKDAVSAILTGKNQHIAIDTEKIKCDWIERQLYYHDSKLGITEKKVHINAKITKVMFIMSIGLFILLWSFEMLTVDLMGAELSLGTLPNLLWIHDGAILPVRGLFKIALGIISAITLFLSSYYSRLSLDRKLSDHEKMAMLYRTAIKKWNIPDTDREVLMLELAREEVIENGVWLSYCRDNAPSISI